MIPLSIVKLHPSSCVCGDADSDAETVVTCRSFLVVVCVFVCDEGEEIVNTGTELFAGLVGIVSMTTEASATGNLT